MDQSHSIEVSTHTLLGGLPPEALAAIPQARDAR
jgi:hypothetical protein